MKRIVSYLVLLFLLVSGISNKAKAQAEELQQLALNIEKLAQFKQILSDLKAGYQIISQGYGTIKDIAEGNFNIHKTFLDGLYLVSPEVKKYYRVVQIVEYQIALVKEFNGTIDRIRRDQTFSPQELLYLMQVYERILKSSLRNLDELTMILTSHQLRMSDDERIRAIDDIHTDMLDKLEFARYFNSKNRVLSIQRQKERNDIQTSQKLK